MSRKKTLDEFILEAKNLHGDKYDYSLITEYNGLSSNLVLSCPIHEEFSVVASKHIFRKQGCSQCNKESLSKIKRLTTQEFIERACNIHKSTYDYSLVNYVKSNDKVDIICKEHGLFQQQPNNHLSGQGCPTCKTKKTISRLTKSTEQFIQECNDRHNYKYDYSNTEYKTCKDTIKVICPIHGEFEVQADNHKRKDGCCKCKKEEYRQKRLSTFLDKAREVHGGKYDYSKVNYINNTIKIEITCPIHGQFTQLPSGHLVNGGCEKCGKEKREDMKMSTQDFIVKSVETHNNRYSYENAEYLNAKTDVEIVCKKHGVFKQNPLRHINGSGCSKCSTKEKGLLIRKDTDHFVKKAKEIHGDRYDYSLVEYNHSREEVDIVCSIHGKFRQKPSTHLKNSGCQLCATEINIYKREDYVRLSKTATLYLVLMQYGDEKFYKIGKTKNTTSQRLKNNVSSYSFQVINEYVDDTGSIFDLEIDLHRRFLKYRYKPSLFFNGHTECYNLDLPIQEIINIGCQTE